MKNSIPFGKPPAYFNANNIKDYKEKLSKKEKEISAIKEKISKVILEIQSVDNDISKYDKLINNEEDEGERLRHFLNYLITQTSYN